MPASPELSFSKGWESVKKHIKRRRRVTGLRPVNFDRKAALAASDIAYQEYLQRKAKREVVLFKARKRTAQKFCAKSQRERKHEAPQ
jgi:hypothetical protein